MIGLPAFVFRVVRVLRIAPRVRTVLRVRVGERFATKNPQNQKLRHSS